MLRSAPLLFLASTFIFRPAIIKRTHVFSKCRVFSFSGASQISMGRMSDILEIMGPLDNLFPSPDVGFYVGVIRKCRKSGDFVVGRSVHVHLIKSGLVVEPLMSNVLLDVYGSMGWLDECLKLFEEMPVRDVVSWCTLISGYVRHGLGFEAFGVFKSMCWSGLVKPNHFIISSMLKGCSSSGTGELGLQVHGLIIKTGLGFDRYVEIGLVDMYAKCGDVGDALNLFYGIPAKSSISWNAMISGFVQNGFLTEAVGLCIEMCRAGLVMDLVTLRVVSSAGSALELFHFSQNLHAYSVKIGLAFDSYVVAEHVRLLAKLGEVDYMGKLFNDVKNPDVSLFSLLISGYHSNNHRVEAVELVEKLLKLDLNLNEGVLVSILNLCFCKEEGTQVHAHILKAGHVLYISVNNSLISMYMKFGMMKDADMTFCKMPVTDVVSWTAIMAGYVQNLRFGEALKIFCAFRRTGMNLDQYPFATIINACTGFRAINQGQQIHSLALKLGIEFSDFLNASLLHMYAKCGFLDSATRLFSYMPSPHGLVPTNVMLAGYCWNFQPEKALELFCAEYQMRLAPDKFSFSTVLGACTDLRSIKMGEQIHSRIIKSGLEVSDVVGNAIINMYMRSGNTENALKFFYGMESTL